MTAAPSHSPTSQGAPSTRAPSPRSGAAEGDRDVPSVPSTPSSSAAHSSNNKHHSNQHRKTNSLSSPRPASTHAARPLSLRHSQVQGLTEEQLRALRGETENEEREKEIEKERDTKPSSIMVIAPETLPPSPPLTSQDTDGDADVDTEEAVDGASRMEREEEDVADAWRHHHPGGSVDAAAKRSMDVVTDDQHPLSFSARDPDAAAYEKDDHAHAAVRISLEHNRDEGGGGPGHEARRHPLDEADIAEPAGVTKPFQVVRPPRRQPTSSQKPPHSSYYVGPPTGSTAYYTGPRGQIGVHHPREIVRVERDYDHGELVQFSSSYPLELQGRITPTQFLETVNALNEGLIRAHSVGGACVDNTLAVLTLWMSTLVVESRYEREMRRLQRLVDALNAELYNPQGLNILWPRRSAFLFLEIEYY